MNSNHSNKPEIRIRTVPTDCVDVFDEAYFDADTQVESVIISRYAIGLADAIQVIISFSAGVSVNLLSSWIYDKLSGKSPQHLYINDHQIELKEEDIKRLIEEVINKKNTDDKKNNTGNPNGCQ